MSLEYILGQARAPQKSKAEGIQDSAGYMWVSFTRAEEKQVMVNVASTGSNVDGTNTYVPALYRVLGTATPDALFVYTPAVRRPPHPITPKG